MAQPKAVQGLKRAAESFHVSLQTFCESFTRGADRLPCRVRSLPVRLPAGERLLRGGGISSRPRRRRGVDPFTRLAGALGAAGRAARSRRNALCVSWRDSGTGADLYRRASFRLDAGLRPFWLEFCRRWTDGGL